MNKVCGKCKKETDEVYRFRMPLYQGGFRDIDLCFDCNEIIRNKHKQFLDKIKNYLQGVSL